MNKMNHITRMSSYQRVRRGVDCFVSKARNNLAMTNTEQSVKLKKAIIAELDAIIEILENRNINHLLIKSTGVNIFKKYDKQFNAIILECYDLIVKIRDEHTKQLFKEALRKLYDHELTEHELFNLFEKHLGYKLGDDLVKPMQKFTEAFYKIGAKSVTLPTTRMGYNVVDQDALKLINNQNIFLIDKYYDQHTGDIMKNEISLLFANATTQNEIASRMESLMVADKKLGDKYFKAYVDKTAARVRNVGAIQRFHELGYKVYQIHATLDDKTTDICREMNGRLIETEPAYDTVDAYLHIPLSEDGVPRPANDVLHEIDALLPFWDHNKTKTLSGLSTEKILNDNPGLALPPYHWGCRTEARPYFAKGQKPVYEEGRVPKGEEDARTYHVDHNVSKTTKNYVNSLDPHELALKLDAIDKMQNHPYNIKDLTSDGKHIKQFKLADEKELIDKANEIIEKSYKKGLRAYTTAKGITQLQVVYFAENIGYTVVDMAGKIRCVTRHKDVEKAIQRLGEYIILN